MRWYFDYISPYAYLQSTRLAALEKYQSIECVPVLFAGLLQHWENVGPAEILPKRKWTFRDAVWLAHRDGIELTLPPSHPFNPLPLLRLGIVHNNAVEVVNRLFRYVWVEGKSPQDEKAFTALLQELNTTPAELQQDAVKSQLLKNGKEAIAADVFGVPTISINDHLFWGYGATEQVMALLEDPAQMPLDAMRAADNLPQGKARPHGNPKSNESQPNHHAVSKVVKTAPRIPLKPIDIKEPADLVNTIRKRRGGELIALDRLLLYSTPLAEGWNHYLGNIREHFAISQQLRELAMCTVAILNNAEYEYAQHAPIYIKTGGTQAKADLIRHPQQAAGNDLFTQAEQITLALTTQLTRDVKIEQALFDQALQHFGPEDLVELIATIAAYNMVSRFLVAFELHPD